MALFNPNTRNPAWIVHKVSSLMSGKKEIPIIKSATAKLTSINLGAVRVDLNVINVPIISEAPIMDNEPDTALTALTAVMKSVDVVFIVRRDLIEMTCPRPAARL